MSTQTLTSEYMLLFRGTDWHKDLSAEQMHQIATRWMAWFQGLNQQGKALPGNPPDHRAEFVSGPHHHHPDHPLSQSKETVAGYFLLHVNNFDEALAIAKQCPALPYGVVVEVRPIDDIYPMSEEVLIRNRQATLTAVDL